MDGRWMALAVLTTARASLGVQFQSVASVSAPLIDGFGLSYADLGLLVGLYFLPGIVIALPGGALGRRFGDTRVVLAGLALMAAGGALLAAAESPATLFAGRLLSGVGAVLLNVLMAKMVTDWFAGREIVLAMAIFVNSFPIGVGLAMLALGAIQDAAGWRTAMLVTAGTAALAFALVLLAYRPHPGTTQASAATTRSRLSRREVAKVSVAGAIWGIYNGAFAITFAFAPAYLTGAGAGHVGLLIGVVAWLMVASVQAGGLLAQRWGRPGLLMALGVGAWGMGLVLLPLLPPVPVLLMIGLLQGLPVGVIMSLPAVALRPENRALGMGVFYTWLYVGHAGLPPLAGWVQDASGHPAGALLLAGAVVLGILPLFLLFRALPGPEPSRPA
jgi:cyanate permease